MNLNADAIIQTEDPVEVEFDYISTNVHTKNIALLSDEPVVQVFDYVINKIASTPMVVGTNTPIIACLGDTGHIHAGSILWGCDVGICTENVIPLVLTGPLFYDTSKYRDTGRYCDSRVLIPWALNIKPVIQGNKVTMITGSDLSNYKEEMLSKGIRVVSTHDTIKHQLEEIASSRLVVTDSVSALIFAETLGIPVFPFVRHVSKMKFMNYYMGTGRDIKNIEFLDFSDRIVLDKLPEPYKVKHDIDFLLSRIPFRHEEEAVKEIKAYYNEIQKYK